MARHRTSWSTAVLRFIVAALASGLIPAHTMAQGTPSAGSVPLKIGLVTPLTGVLAATGIRTQRGFRMALEDINKAGGVAGRQLIAVEEDAGASPTTSVTAARRLLEQSPVSIMGPLFGTFNLAMSDLFKENEVPAMYTSGTAALDDTGNPWMFGLHPSDRVRGAAITKFVVEKLGAKRLAVQYVNNAYGQGAFEIVRQALAGTSAQVVSAQSHQPEDRDMSAQLRKAQEAKADAIFVWTFSPDGGVIIRQLHELQFGGVKFGASTIGLPEILDLVTAEQLRGWYGEVAAFLVGNENPTVKQWVTRYRNQYRELPGTFDALTYDGIRMMAVALEQALRVNPNATLKELRMGLRDRLSTLAYQGLATSYKADAKRRLSHCFTILQIGDQKEYKKVGETC